MEAAKKTEDAAIAECVRLYPDPNQKPATPRIKCLANVEHDPHDPYGDLVRLMKAQIVVLAERYDAGGMVVSLAVEAWKFQ
jgi:hypothetical protein